MGFFVDPDNDNIYTGAGVIVVEDYYDVDKKKIPCIILVRNKTSGIYSDFGGTYEKKDNDLSITARNELMEESLNLLKIPIEYFDKYIDIGTSAMSDKYYRVFILKVNGICRKYFLYNKKLLDGTNKYSQLKVPKYWKETDNIVHIPIHGIEFDKLHDKYKRHNKYNHLYDVTGKEIKIHNRAKKAIYHCKEHLFDMIYEKPIASRKDIIFTKSNDFLNGTYSLNI